MSGNVLESGNTALNKTDEVKPWSIDVYLLIRETDNRQINT